MLTQHPLDQGQLNRWYNPNDSTNLPLGGPLGPARGTTIPVPLQLPTITTPRKIKAIEYFGNGLVKRVEYED